jgi:hypothetical protein
MGYKAAVESVRKAAYEADPEGYVQRGRTERKHRRVGIRPAPDTMAALTGYLPVEQGIACYAALRRHADAAKATGDSRTRDQIMADTMVERLTGQATAADVNIELQLLMPVDSLINPDDQRAAMIPGYGPLPAGLAWEIVASRAGTSNSSTAASTAGRTRSSSPHPPGTTTSAAHPTHHKTKAFYAVRDRAGTTRNGRASGNITLTGFFRSHLPRRPASTG